MLINAYGLQFVMLLADHRLERLCYKSGPRCSLYELKHHETLLTLCDHCWSANRPGCRIFCFSSAAPGQFRAICGWGKPALDHSPFNFGSDSVGGTTSEPSRARGHPAK
jgi:hypothetical protein